MEHMLIIFLIHYASCSPLLASQNADFDDSNHPRGLVRLHPAQIAKRQAYYQYNNAYNQPQYYSTLPPSSYQGSPSGQPSNVSPYSTPSYSYNNGNSQYSNGYGSGLDYLRNADQDALKEAAKEYQEEMMKKYGLDSDEIEEKEKKKKHQLNLALGLGIGFGVALLLFVISIIVYCCYYRKKQNPPHVKFYQTMFSKTRKQNEYWKEDEMVKKTNESEACLWRLDAAFVKVNYDEKLGAGAFCNVYKGRIIGEAPVCKVSPSLVASTQFKDCECAVKQLPEFADDIARSDFIQEINFMKTLRYHAHLVSMLGWVDDGTSPMLLVEFCKQGDLLHLLRSKKDEIIKGYENDGSLKIRDLVSFSWQIANGLEYLSSLGCIHRDIAARNVLVDGNNVAKISDFGLCRLTDCLLYTGRGGRLPLKWMAPESLESFEYTEKSDVWSYGILSYEIFSFGEVPYSLVQSSDLLEFLKSGKRLIRPSYCPLEIYTLMLSCWKMSPEERPSFTEICATLRAIIESSAENYGYVDAVYNYQSTLPQESRNDTDNDVDSGNSGSNNTGDG